MSDPTDRLIERVRAIMPELEIREWSHNSEGTINDVIIVNDEFVFRFIKDERYLRTLEVELRVLDLVRPHVGLDVPAPVYRSADCIAYPLLGGRTLSRKLALGFEPPVRAAVAAQIGTFLHRLHNVDVSAAGELPATRAPVRRENWVDIQARVRRHVYPLLQHHQIEWAEDLLNGALQTPGFFEHAPSLIHGDLAPYHFLFDDRREAISGVIDFGMAGLGDPASDIGGLISIYGETFVRAIGPTYPDLESYLPRARFYAQSIELEWTLLGLERGENFWFAAHLAGARDIF
ncbi:MAG TPA: phosphotransferase [Herpetosiphonaceae bacterium]|nr:phosphotransferase [Herpetosiphonaceae bacterium]